MPGGLSPGQPVCSSSALQVDWKTRRGSEGGLGTSSWDFLFAKAAGSHKSQNRVPGRDRDSETQRQLRRKSGRERVGGPAASAWSSRGISGARRHGGEFSLPLSPCLQKHPGSTLIRKRSHCSEYSTERHGVSSHSPEVLLRVQFKVYVRHPFLSKVTRPLARLRM